MNPNLPVRTVMVVEDSPVQRLALMRLLAGMGLDEVFEAVDGLAAIEQLESIGRVDLLITDLDMPTMDGVELLETLSGKDLVGAYIVTTARDTQILDAVEAMANERSLCFLGTVPKPVTEEVLCALLQRLVDGSWEHRRTEDKAASSTLLLTNEEIEAALSRREIVPYFQPKVSVASGALAGVESLARWMHPQLGLLLPERFIPHLERSPLLEEFTLAFLDETCRQLVSWDRRGVVLKASVNLAAPSISSRSLVEGVLRVVYSHGLEPERIIIEVTETMLLSDLSVAMGTLAKLRLKGFGLAMDDYGTGYSSMHQLSRCPFTELKIDRAFVNGAHHKAGLRAILESSIALSRTLRLTSVAEGVEQEEDLQLLRELGCDYAQGFLLGRPMPGTEVLPWIERDPRRAPLALAR